MIWDQSNYIWPEGKNSAACFSVDVDANAPYLWQHRNKLPKTVAIADHRQYGMRVGLSRIVKMLDSISIKGSFFVPGVVAEDNPDLFDPPQHLKYFIKTHVNQVGYAYSVINSTHRVDLKGEKISEITEDEKKHSKKICREYHQRRQAQFLEKILQQLPKCFFKNFRQRAPISEKVIEQLQEKYPKESLVLIKKVIEYYKSNYSYHENIAMEKFTHFIGINGENLDEITKEHREEASKVAKDLRERINKKK